MARLVKNISRICEHSEEVQITEETADIVKSIKNILQKREDLVSLSAPQIGKNKRIFALKFSDGIKVFLNPIVYNVSKRLTLSREHLIGLTNDYILPRHEEIVGAYQTESGEIKAHQFKGVASILFQQQCDILNGVTIADIGLEVLPEFDAASVQEQNDLINIYIKGIQSRSAELQSEIKSDKKLSKLMQAIDFYRDLQLGKVSLEDINSNETKEIVAPAEIAVNDAVTTEEVESTDATNTD